MWFGQPSAFYMQAIGEDEAGFLPSRYMAMLGIETSGYIKNRWSYRWYAEWAGVSCDIFKSEQGFGCAYNHGIYETGYRYRGRVVGHPAESDARIVSTGFVLVSNSDTQWHALIRTGDLNRGGAARNTLTPIPLELNSIDLTHSRSLGRFGWLDIGLGYEMITDGLTNEDRDDARGFVTWRSK